MSHAYLLLTPILIFLVVALVGFVGCGFTAGSLAETVNPPIDLMATPGNNKVDLSWTRDPLGLEPVTYHVKRGLASKQYGTPIDVDAPTTTYPDTTAMNGITYYYAVSADDSEDSAEVQVVLGLNSLIVSNNPGTPRNDYTGFVGMGLTVGAQPLVVRRLGRMVLSGNNGTHQMKIVDGATKADVPGSAITLNIAGAPAGMFAYAPLAAPVTLNAGADYYLISQELAGGDQFLDSNTTVTTTAVVSKVYAVNGDGAGNYTTSPTPGTIYGPLDLQY
jgi:hypothetical protein